MKLLSHCFGGQNSFVFDLFLVKKNVGCGGMAVVSLPPLGGQRPVSATNLVQELCQGGLVWRSTAAAAPPHRCRGGGALVLCIKPTSSFPVPQIPS